MKCDNSLCNFVTLQGKVEARIGSRDLYSVYNQQPFAACLSPDRLLGMPDFGENPVALDLYTVPRCNKQRVGSLQLQIVHFSA